MDEQVAQEQACEAREQQRTRCEAVRVGARHIPREDATERGVVIDAPEREFDGAGIHARVQVGQPGLGRAGDGVVVRVRTGVGILEHALDERACPGCAQHRGGAHGWREFDLGPKRVAHRVGPHLEVIEIGPRMMQRCDHGVRMLGDTLGARTLGGVEADRSAAPDALGFAGRDVDRPRGPRLVIDEQPRPGVVAGAGEVLGADELRDQPGVPPLGVVPGHDQGPIGRQPEGRARVEGGRIVGAPERVPPVIGRRVADDGRFGGVHPVPAALGRRSLQRSSSRSKTSR
ncbi:MAG: hypothetical protein Tsb0013_14640 [Phycisphaerales bacterium]